jgi:superfamily II DNA or RNA helicase
MAPDARNRTAPARHTAPRLRPWQEKALADFESSQSPDFLAVATPGAGKTSFALSAARRALAAARASDERRRARIVVVVPTEHLKTQWAQVADGFGLCLEPDWAESRGTLPADVHGVVVTYQQLGSSWKALRGLAKGGFVVLDEIHHAGESHAWGDGVRRAFDGAARRLGLSGTPFRSDANPIPFVRYEHEEARPDFEYGYGDALAEGGVVRPVFFPRVNGRMEWTAPDGTHAAHTFEDALDAAGSGQRLRTALSLEGEWLPAVLARAHEELVALRARDPRAGGMVIAVDQGHARGIARLLRERLGVVAAVATSDDPTASQRIARFASGTSAWIVAVRMVSEGVDVPRLRVGVYATATTTELFFRQAVGRFVRFTGGPPDERAVVFIPDDPRLRTYAARVQEQRRHALHRAREAEALGARGGLDLEAPATAAPGERAPQLSLFAPISAVALDAEGRPIVPLSPAPVATAPADEPASAAPTAGAAEAPPLSRRQRKQSLRDRNAEKVRALARAKRMTHLEVNAELNRRAGIRRVDEATEEQLERRLTAAEAWLAKR